MATVVEKIFSKKAGRSVKAGDFVTARVDACMLQDVNGPTVVEQFSSIADTVRSPDHHMIVLDHFSPCPNVASANKHKLLRRFAVQHGIHLVDAGRGICHQVMLESGMVRPGELVVGTDSHACMYGVLNAFGVGVGAADAAVILAGDEAWFRVPESIRVVLTGVPSKKVSGKDVALALIEKLSTLDTNYRSLEFEGDGISELSMDSRAVICNMAIEAGAKGAVMPLDAAARKWLREHGIPEGEGVVPDSDAVYAATVTLDLSELCPLVAVPPHMNTLQKAEELNHVAVDQVVIGSCTNGRYEDFAVAAEILKDKSVHSGVRFLLFPSSVEVERAIRRDGILDILMNAGASVFPPVCGPCAGIHCGLVGDDEVVLSTTNRNLTGRMGSRKGLVYISSPLVAAYSALNGYISDCEAVL